MNSASGIAYVNGVAFWSPRLPGWALAQRVLRGEAPANSADAPRPAPVLLPPNERRRAPDTVAISIEVANEACAQSGCDPRELISVFVSTHGDLAVTDYMCATLASNPGMVSPTKFHNSVHNAAAGYWTIATGCMAPYTALSADEFSFAQGLLEALLQAGEQRDVLFVAYDIEACGPLATVAPSEGMLGVALVLSHRHTAATQASLRWEAQASAAARNTTALPRNSALAGGNAMATCLPMMEALAGAIDKMSYALGPALVMRIEMTGLPHGAENLA